ncbi:hypothetical protein thsrh120_54950 [Rhizobium sp. No.120]
MIGKGIQMDEIKKIKNLVSTLSGRSGTKDGQRKFYILEDRLPGKEAGILKHEAEFLAALVLDRGKAMNAYLTLCWRKEIADNPE